MWNKVKPITLEIKQINDDKSSFIYSFYSFDSELVKIDNVLHLDDKNDIIGCYSRLKDTEDKCKLPLNFFTEKINKKTTDKLIQYYENPRLFIELL